jgi:hypothetical protein
LTAERVHWGEEPLHAEDNQALVRRYIEEVINKGNTTAIDELVAPDYLGHSTGLQR